MYLPGSEQETTTQPGDRAVKHSQVSVTGIFIHTVTALVLWRYKQNTSHELARLITLVTKPVFYFLLIFFISFKAKLPATNSRDSSHMSLNQFFIFC
jgi:putative flippase GtrA